MQESTNFQCETCETGEWKQQPASKEKEYEIIRQVETGASCTIALVKVKIPPSHHPSSSSGLPSGLQSYEQYTVGIVRLTLDGNPLPPEVERRQMELAQHLCKHDVSVVPPLFTLSNGQVVWKYIPESLEVELLATAEEANTCGVDKLSLEKLETNVKLIRAAISILARGNSIGIHFYDSHDGNFLFDRKDGRVYLCDPDMWRDCRKGFSPKIENKCWGVPVNKYQDPNDIGRFAESLRQTHPLNLMLVSNMAFEKWASFYLKLLKHKKSHDAEMARSGRTQDSDCEEEKEKEKESESDTESESETGTGTETETETEVTETEVQRENDKKSANQSARQKKSKSETERKRKRKRKRQSREHKQKGNGTRRSIEKRGKKEEKEGKEEKRRSSKRTKTGWWQEKNSQDVKKDEERILCQKEVEDQDDYSRCFGCLAWLFVTSDHWMSRVSLWKKWVSGNVRLVNLTNRLSKELCEGLCLGSIPPLMDWQPDIKNQIHEVSCRFVGLHARITEDSPNHDFAPEEFHFYEKITSLWKSLTSPKAAQQTKR